VPPSIGAVAGPWVTRHDAPPVDRVALLPWPQTSNSAAMDQAEIADLDLDAVRRTIDAVGREGEHGEAAEPDVGEVLQVAGDDTCGAQTR
jgi:hypothetical protein